MSIDWSAYRITLLLYLGVLLLPISFYFSYSSFSEIQSDTKMLNSMTLNSASMLTLDNNLNPLEKQNIIKNVDLVFQNLRPWMFENDGKSFYVGTEPLLKKYDSLLDCWNNSKNSDKKMLITCFKKAKSLIFSLDNMLKLKQNKIYNIFYVNLFVSMALLFTLIFLSRIYIYKQLKKQALYDLETKLFTKDYLLALLKEITAQMTRSKESLTVLHIDVEDLKSNDNSLKKENKKVLRQIGTSLLHTLRVSDIACRYSDSEFMIVLPNTKSQNIKKLTIRIDKDFSNIKHTIKVIEYKEDETYDDFIARLV